MSEWAERAIGFGKFLNEIVGDNFIGANVVNTAATSGRWTFLVFVFPFTAFKVTIIIMIDVRFFDKQQNRKTKLCANRKQWLNMDDD